MRILVTGATGFIGSNLTLELLSQGHEVVAITSKDGQELPKLEGLQMLEKGFVNLSFLGRFDAVFHQAALTDTTIRDEKTMFDANVKYSKKLFRNVLKNGCRHIVFASSTAVYGDSPAPYIEKITQLNPLNAYARSKRTLEELAREFAQNPNIVVVGLRYCNVYGPRESHKKKAASMIYQLAKQMLDGDPKIFKYGEQKRDYIYVDDVVRANILALQLEQSTILNCGTGDTTTFNDLIKILNLVLGTNREPIYIDNPYEDRYQNHTQCDTTLANKILGFIPKFNILEGVKQYYQSGYLTK